MKRGIRVISTLALVVWSLFGCTNETSGTNGNTQPADLPEPENLVHKTTLSVAPDGPHLTLFLRGSGETISDIDIYDTETAERLQQIQGVDAQPVGLDEMGFYIEDMNFDGFLDFRIMEMLPVGANVPYKCWLFDPRTGLYAQNELLSGLLSPRFDQDNKEVRSSERINAASYLDTIYAFENGEPVKIREEETVFYPEEKNRTITIREPRNGAWVVTETITEPMEE